MVRIRLALPVLLVLLVSLSLAQPLAAEQPPFTQTVGFATKTGFRGVFAWKASEPVLGVVHYGTNPTSLDRTAQPLPGGVADTAQMAVGQLVKGETYYWQVEDTRTGRRSDVKSFRSVNAYNDWNGTVYTLNLLVQLDLQSLPADIPADLALSDIAAGINVFAERLYDAMDGYARIGTVIVTDTNLDYPGNPPAYMPVCTNDFSSLSDVLIQTTVPFDSHTWSGWSIDNPCISFYVGRIGQLVVPWENDLHFGYVSTHEMMHYAFNAPDLYLDNSDADCRNLDWDGSLMHNTGGFVNGRWELSEIDRNPVLTPCNHGTQPYSWDALRQRYTNVPANDFGPIGHLIDVKPRGNEDGGALQIFVLDREPGASTLTAFTPDDQDPACSNTAAQIVDPAGDATGALIVESTPLASDPSLDILEGRLTWDPALEAVNFKIKVTDLPPVAATDGPNGHHFRFFFDYNGVRYQVRARRDGLGPATGSLADSAGTAIATGLPTTFDAATDVVTVTLSADKFTAAVPGSPRFAPGGVLSGLEILAQRLLVAVTLTSDTARGGCTYRINQERDAENRPPVTAADAATTAEETAVDVTVLANDGDPDGDALSVQSVSAPANGVASTNANGSVKYTPNTNFHGTDTFSYVASDNKGGSAAGTVTITVTGTPDAPIANPDSANAASGQSVTISVLANDSDPDGDTLTVASVTNGVYGKATTNGTTVTYTPGGGFTEKDSFTYTLRDTTGRTATAAVTIFRTSCLGSFTDDLELAPEPGWTFNNANGGPVAATTWTHIVDPFASSPVHVFFSDASDASPSKDDRLVAPPQKITSTTTLSFRHRFRTEVRFDGGVLEVSTNGGATYQDVIAAGGRWVRGGYNGEANALNGRKAWTGSSSSANAMDEVVVELGALAGQTVHVRWRLVTDTNLGDAGWWVDDIRFTNILTANCGGSANRAPNAVDDSAFTQAGTSVAIDALANDSDPDGDTLSIASVDDPANGSASASGGAITYTPDAGFSGTDTFNYTVSDGWGGSDTARVTVRVNGPPDAVNDAATTNEDQPVTIDVTGNDSDPNGDALTVTGATQGANGATYVNPDGTVLYTPRANFHGSDAFQYTVSDGNGTTDTATVSVTVTSVNDAPVAANDSATAERNRTITINVLGNDTDADGDALSVVSVSRASSGGTVTINSNNTIRFRPRPGFTGSDSFTYTISDGRGGMSTATVTVTVAAH